MFDDCRVTLAVLAVGAIIVWTIIIYGIWLLCI